MDFVGLFEEKSNALVGLTSNGSQRSLKRFSTI